MNKNICIIALLFLGLNAKAQNKILDSLLNLTKTQKDSLLCDTYNELTWQYRNIDRNKAILFGNKALELAKQLNYNKSIAQAYNDLGIIYFDNEKDDSAILLYNKAIAIRREMKDDLGIAKLYNKIGIVYQRQGVFDKALENQFASLRLFEKEKNDFGISYAQNNIGILNQNLGHYQEAVEYYNKSIILKEKINDKIGIAGTFSNMGNIYFLTKDYLKAESYFNKAITIAKEANNKEYLSNALNNIGKLYVETKNLNKAVESINQSLLLRIELNDSKGTASCYNNLADVFVTLKQYNKADSLYKLGLSIAQKAPNCLPEINNMYLALSKLNELQGNTSQALNFLKLFTSTKDSLYTDKVGQTFAELETKYKTLEKEKQIKEQRFEIEKRNYWIAIVLGLIILILVIIYFLYRRNKHKQEVALQNEIIRQQKAAAQAVLLAEENERKRIATDLHDGIGQTMSAAKMNLSALQNEFENINTQQKIALNKVIELVDDSCKEVRAVSHSMMPNVIEKNGLDNALKMFINQINSKNLKINLHTQGLSNKLNRNIESILYRVIQECINNVIKHSKASHLDISLIQEQNELSVTIEDNGIGFDTSKASNGIGLENIESRIKFLNGEVEWQSQPQKGTLVAIHLPIQ